VTAIIHKTIWCTDQGWNYRLVIDGAILYFFTIYFQPWPKHDKLLHSFDKAIECVTVLGYNYNQDFLKLCPVKGNEVCYKLPLKSLYKMCHKIK